MSLFTKLGGAPWWPSSAPHCADEDSEAQTGDAHTLAIQGQGQERPGGGPTADRIQRATSETQLPSAPAHPAPGAVLTGQLPSWVSGFSALSLKPLEADTDPGTVGQLQVGQSCQERRAPQRG